MKRFATLLLTLALLASLPARAATFFDDGEQLHRDPFCVDSHFCFQTFYSPAVIYAGAEDALADWKHLCESCALTDEVAAQVDQPAVWYFNPEGGRFYHTNANCPSIHSKYLPLSGTYVAPSSTWTPENPCAFCGASRHIMRGPSDTVAWNATPEEKAALLPGVWTLPSEEAIHYSAAAEAASEHLTSLRSQEMYTISVAHYDQGGPEHPRPTYKVIVTTALRHPVCVAYVDALTGEVYYTHMADEFAQFTP